MKTLVLVRHAKSDWGNENLRDFYRPLNNRGNDDAPRMAAKVRAQKCIPDAILSSPAVRALTTAQYFADEYSFDPGRIRWVSALYESTPEEYLRTIRNLEQSLKTVFMFGHNPTITALVNMLGDLRTDNVPTCGVAAFTFPIIKWEDLGSGKLLFYDYPKKG